MIILDGQICPYLVNKVIKVQRLVDISLELRTQESGLDLLEEELSNSTLELGRDLLRLHRNVHGRNLGGAIGFLGTSEHLTEGSLSGTVLSHHDDDLRVGELSSLDGQIEATKSLSHVWIAVSVRSVNQKFFACLTDAELQRFFTETQVLRGDVAIKEDVDTFTDRRWVGDDTVYSRLSVQQTDKVGKIVQNGQIVLDDDNVVVGLEQTANHAASGQTLLDIKERRWLVKHVDIGLLHTSDGNGETLQLTTRQEIDVTVNDLVEFEFCHDLLQTLLADLGALFDESANRPFGTLDGSGNLVDILWLDNSLEVVLQDLGEVVLQLRSSEVLQDL